MKKLQLIFLLIFCNHCYSAFAQQYTPFPTDSAYWKVIRCFSFYPPGWYDVFTYTQSGDTTLYGISYHKIYETVHHLPGTSYDSTYTYYFGAMREDQQKIYMVSQFATGDELERTIYDFSAQEEGDIIYSHLLNYGDPITVKSIVASIDSVLIDGDYRRRIKLNTIDGYPTGESWTEGIGSNFGLIFSCFYLVSDNSYDLRCFTTESVSYQNDQLGLGFCLSLPEVNCDFATVVPTIPPPLHYSVFPNPVHHQLSLHFKWPDTKLVQAVLYSFTGQKVLQELIQPAHEMSINVESLPNGPYLLLVIHENGFCESTKVILE
ncbi:MAG: T9SS type A sorting domain-containing protein [Chitinophagales bacterium]